MMKNRAVFLDRDGTINADKGYIYRIEDFVFLPGVLEGLTLLQRAGYLLIILSNQSGIARGYYTEEDYQKLTAWMLAELQKNGITIAGSCYCPHHPQGVVERYRKVCDCRKPQTGMFEAAVREHDLDISTCYAIGDRLRDCAICKAGGCRGFLIGNNEKTEVIEQVKHGAVANVTYASDLYECACKIVEDKLRD